MNLNNLTKETQKVILKIAEKSKPHEMCGFIVRDEVWRAYYPEYPFVPCDNVATNPAETFEMDWDFMTYYDGMVVAIVHSHPDGEPFLSGADRQSQVATDLPWVLVVNGQLKWFEPVPHLRGREFVYDEADCCRLIQDAYHLCGLDLPDCPRIDIDTDIKQKTLFRYFKKSDVFYRVVHDLQAGDVILTQSGSFTPEHALLYLGNDEMLHHAHGHLSRKEPYHSYWQKCTHSIWRHREFKADMMTAIFNDLIHSE